MQNENYIFDIPIDQSQSLEVSIKVIEKLKEIDKDSIEFRSIFLVDSIEKTEFKISELNELPENIKQVLKTSPLSFPNRESLLQSFMASTASGLQLLRLNQIVYFEYLTEKKLWSVLLSDQTQLYLKRKTIAENILSYSQDFVQINQKQIINLEYLVRIVGRSCQLSIYIGNENKFIISRIYLKGLQERIEVI